MTAKITNRVYTARQLRLRARFARRVKRLFSVQLKQLDFSQSEEAAAVINADVGVDTAGHITDLMESGECCRHRSAAAAAPGSLAGAVQVFEGNVWLSLTSGKAAGCSHPTVLC